MFVWPLQSSQPFGATAVGHIVMLPMGWRRPVQRVGERLDIAGDIDGVARDRVGQVEVRSRAGHQGVPSACTVARMSASVMTAMSEPG
jgi:hypothetical protein